MSMDPRPKQMGRHSRGGVIADEYILMNLICE